MLQRGSAHSAPEDDFAAATQLGLEWDAGERDETWLISYADILSVILAMVVLLFGRMAMVAAPPIEVVAAAEPTAAGDVASAALEVAVVEAAPVEAATLGIAKAEAAVADLPAIAVTTTTDLPTQEDRLALLVEERFDGRIKTEQRSEGVVLTIPEVALFDSARAALQASATPLLAELGATLREVGDVQIAVEGHTDDRPVQGGEFASNWDLAAARANAVTRYLLERGFAPYRLHSVSYADTRPVEDNGTAEGRAANRRVELKIEFVNTAGQSPALATNLNR
jgi:chemotaxis protein MotB